MPHTKPRTPSYRHHKPSGQAVVTLNGQDFYLGRHRSAASRHEFDRLIAEWLACGRQVTASVNKPDYTVTEVIARFWKHAKDYYRKPDGTTTSELGLFKYALGVLKKLYGDTPAREFGPLSLQTVRSAMVDKSWSREYVNRQVARLKQVFKWAVSQELVPATVFQALQTVTGLRKGQTEAPEGVPVKPVPDEFVDAIKPFVSRQVWAIVELQRLTGMRAGEVTIMRATDLNMTGKLWMFEPELHKTAHHGHHRVIELGPRAQQVIRPFLKTDLDAFLFAPIEAEQERIEANTQNRKTPVSCGNRPGSNRKRNPKRRPRERYDTDSYRRAVQRGCDKADAEAKRKESLPEDSERIIPRWHPHRLRHSYATAIRKDHGIESARILLGHRSVGVTEIYAEIDRAKVRSIIEKIG